MKSIYRILSLFLLIISLFACASITPNMLQPERDPLARKLLPLKIGLSDENIIKSETMNTTTYQTATATIFERELETNIFKNDRNRWGFIEFTTTFENTSITFVGGVLLGAHIVTLFIPSLLGLPCCQYKYEKEVEITIYDSKKIEIKKYRYSDTKYYFNNYYQDIEQFFKKDSIPFEKIKIEMTKEILNKFRKDIAPDIEYINSELSKVGSL